MDIEIVKVPESARYEVRSEGRVVGVAVMAAGIGIIGALASILANLLAVAAMVESGRWKKGDHILTVAASFPTTINPLLLYGYGAYGANSDASVKRLKGETRPIQGDVEMTMIYAQASLDIGKADDAAYALARAEAEGNNDWRLLSIIGVTMDTLDQHGPAQEYYRRALALSPDNPKILSNLALSYILQGKPALAEQTLRQAASQPGADSRITQNLILALGVQGKFDEVDQVAGPELPKAMVDANREYFRSLLNPSRTWDTLRGTQP